MISITKLALVALLSSYTFAHMMMNTPEPYGKSSLNNSPLAADGSDFPCKQRPGVYDAEGASNVFTIGESNTLSFIGSATHGGGSCQISLTTDLQPTKDSKWMVIKSIEGGCPTNSSGNFAGNAAATTDAATFQYTIPDGIAPGEYTIAWSWNNKVGNREFYMNCGPATITAAKKRRYAPAPKISKRQASFPDLFVANLAGINDCTTPESYDYQYPDPGSVIQSAGLGPYTQLACGAAGSSNVPAATPTGSAPAGGNGGSGTTATATTDGSASSVIASSDASPTASSPGTFASGAAPAGVFPSGASQPSGTGTAPVPAGAGSTSQTPGAPCSDEGSWTCSSSGTSYIRCASGVFSVSMPMPAGLVCTPGTSDTLQMVAAESGSGKRVVRRSKQWIAY